MQKDKVIAELQNGSSSSAGQPSQSTGLATERGAPPSDRVTATAAPPAVASQQTQASAATIPSGINSAADHFRGSLDPSSFLVAAHQGLIGGMGAIPGAMGQHLSYGPGGVLSRTANMGAGHAFSRDGSGAPAFPAGFMPFVGFPSAAAASAFGQGFYPGAHLHGLHPTPQAHQGNPQQMYRSAAALSNAEQGASSQNEQSLHPRPGAALPQHHIGHNSHLSADTNPKEDEPTSTGGDQNDLAQGPPTTRAPRAAS